nr:MAG TPA: hypothetical protein [Caudoviricetes sp.]
MEYEVCYIKMFYGIGRNTFSWHILQSFNCIYGRD